ncbi:hypothetical protein SDRG_04223 [Saprolegnia diclina VS20]|uniref:Uncharacterized protein n=1 Tax=Saprolegnia diclina (strain VS20) TaxID=1156394 RepID=T0QV43_SAPDV|nr:hypothetical protein SDRG_04223 [Saprolegnia diclina VS20]EQC38516.1 hypothetical protein SDRG_04223 [Saprolegnia diclina VS20]|eukprot:XP_008608108.1 hypothetical protein SDRG_04223 [Saprolegnia diclina VS20]
MLRHVPCRRYLYTLHPPALATSAYVPLHGPRVVYLERTEGGVPFEPSQPPRIEPPCQVTYLSPRMLALTFADASELNTSLFIDGQVVPLPRQLVDVDVDGEHTPPLEFMNQALMAGRNTIGVFELASTSLRLAELQAAIEPRLKRTRATFATLFRLYDPKTKRFHALRDSTPVGPHFLALTSDEATTTLVDRIAAVPMDAYRPWELWLVRGSRDGIVFRVPHGIIDGMGCIQFLQRVLADAPCPSTIRPQRTSTRHFTDVVDALGRLWDDVSRPAVPYLGFQGRRDGFGSLARFYAALTPATEAPQTCLCRIPLTSFQTIARRHSVTVSQVLVAALGDALRTLLLTNFDAALVESLQLQVRLPVDARHGDVDRMQADLVAICLPLHVEMVEANDRLRAVARAGQSIQKDIAVRRWCRDAGLALVPRWLLGHVPVPPRGSWSSPMYASSVVGPAARLRIAGRPLDAFYFMSSDLDYRNAHMLEVVSVSYDGQMQLSLRTLLGRSLDLEHFQDALVAAIDRLASMKHDQ